MSEQKKPDNGIPLFPLLCAGVIITSIALPALLIAGGLYLLTRGKDD
ncbi:MAG: hypothetical protein KJ569_08190 [Candidatus Omnitrophica bacterium]|nr:hypothetical protein [Candidatus Omnitrophota bacterium]